MADAKGFRPMRPIAERAAAAEEARRFASSGKGKRVPLKFMISPRTLAAFKRAAALQDPPTTMRRMMLRWLQEEGIAVDPADLDGDDAGDE
jgi:D-alanyl-D-alanine carboxypeptidase